MSFLANAIFDATKQKQPPVFCKKGVEGLPLY